MTQHTIGSVAHVQFRAFWKNVLGVLGSLGIFSKQESGKPVKLISIGWKFYCWSLAIIVISEVASVLFHRSSGIRRTMTPNSVQNVDCGSLCAEWLTWLLIDDSWLCRWIWLAVSVSVGQVLLTDEPGRREISTKVCWRWVGWLRPWLNMRRTFHIG